MKQHDNTTVDNNEVLLGNSSCIVHFTNDPGVLKAECNSALPGNQSLRIKVLKKGLAKMDPINFTITTEIVTVRPLTVSAAGKLF